jgi:DNA-binding transcriptional MerR regulator
MLQKDEGAFLTIGEVSKRFGIAAHILRYWETKFTGLRPLQRAGNRRYYRAEDVALVARIDSLLNKEGYTVSGAAKLLADGKASSAAAPNFQTSLSQVAPMPASAATGLSRESLDDLRRIRNRLAAALEAA